MSETPKRTARLSPERRRLLDGLKERRAAVVHKVATKEAPAGAFSLLSSEDRRKLPDGLEDAYPLAHLQLGMLYHMQLSPQGTVIEYHNVYSWDLEIGYVPDLFQQALEALVARHAFLRTAIDLNHYSEPLQLVHCRVAIRVEVVDIRHLPWEEQQRVIEDFVAHERRQLFDLMKPPLMNFHLHRRRDDCIQLSVTELHAISDGWSTMSTLAELFEDYLALYRGEEAPPRPPPAVPYREFIRLEKQTLASEETRRFWKQKLMGYTVARLPRVPSHLRSGGRSEFRKRRFIVEPEVVHRLITFTRRLEVPLKSALLAAHLKVVSLLSSETDLVVGLVSNGRPEQLGGDQVRGLFLNTVPLRLNLHRLSWVELVRRTFAAELETLPHRRFPIAEIQRHWGGGKTLFESSFAYVNFHALTSVLESGEVNFSGIGSLDYSVTNYPLSSVFHRSPVSPDLIMGSLVFDDHELTEAQMTFIRGLYEAVLRAMVEDSDRGRESRSYISPAARHQMVVEWNSQEAVVAPECCVHELFEQQVERTPDAVALTDDERSLSFRELDRRANRLANLLHSEGYGPEAVVAVLLERSSETMVGILGVLKAGAAFLALEPDQPAARLCSILAVADASAIVSRHPLVEPLDWPEERLICLDQEQQQLQRAGAELPASLATVQNLAYVICTSGSTGKPKAISLSHDGLTNHMLWMQRDYGMTTADCLLQKTPLSFDASIWEILLPLVAGARLHMARPGGHQNLDYLSETIQRSRVTYLQCVPSLLALLLETPGFESCLSLEQVFCGGEALAADLVERFSRSPLRAELVNLYGPAEATIQVATWRCRGEVALGGVPIGRPIFGARILLLDSELRPVFLGAAGELCIGGRSLARGYGGQPRLTAEKFVPDPFAKLPGQRLYRTGDLACHRHEGPLVFLGRVDYQVKFHGARIELEEIEAVLQGLDGVLDAAVVVRGESPRHQHLVAFVVPDSGRSITVGVVREFLRGQLPQYMWPSEILTLDALPRTPHGKVDRKALPMGSAGPQGRAGRAPSTPTEEVLAGLWVDLLRVEPPGCEDDFFALGGHSLVAMQLGSRVNQTLGVQLPLERILSFPTLAAMAQQIDRIRDQENDFELPPITKACRGESAALSFAQKRLWFLARLEPDSAAYNIPSAIRLTGGLDAEAVRRALTEVARRHEILRTGIREVDGEPVPFVAAAASFDFLVMDLSALAPQERESVARARTNEQASKPFALDEPPLFRACLLRLAEQDHVLLVVVHHIASDGWSMELLMGECMQLYSAFVAGQPSPLSELPVQYADYAAWQQSWLEGDFLDAQMNYWRQQFADGLPELALPTDRPRSGAFVSGTQELVLTEELSAGLRRLSQREGATLFMTLLTALEILLYRYTSQQDIVVGTQIGGRGTLETEGLIGLFVNVLALRTRVSDELSFRELLTAVRQTALDAYTYRYLPFQKLVEEVQQRRAGAQSILAVTFNLQSVTDAAVPALPNLGVASWPIDFAGAKNDLSLQLRDEPRRLRGAFKYNRALFDPATIERMVGHFEALLEDVLHDPNRKLSSLKLAKADETENLAQGFSEILEPC